MSVFSIIEGKLPKPTARGNLLLVNPDGDLLHPTGTLGDLRPTAVDASHPLVTGIDLNALQVTLASAYEPPENWMQTLVDFGQGAARHGGRTRGPAPSSC